VRTVLFIALRQLWERKLLNGIAILGVTLGVLTLIGINGIMQGFQQKFLQTVIKVSPHVTIFDKELRPAVPPAKLAPNPPDVLAVSHQTPSDRDLRIKRPLEILALLEKDPDVEAAGRAITGSGILRFGPKEYPVVIYGVDPRRQDRVTPLSPFVRNGHFNALDFTSDGIMLGSQVADKIGAKVDDSLVVAGSAGATISMKVVAILESGVVPIDASRVYMNLRNAQTLMNRPDVVSRIEIRLKDTEKGWEVAERVERVFGYDAESWQESNANFLALFKQQNTIISFVVSAILAVSGFGILAIQIMIVLQKTRDIAILRSVGFRRPDILMIFLFQGVVIAITGSIAGNLLGKRLLIFLGALKIKQQGLVKSENFLVYEDPKFYVYGFVFALLIGLIASSIPAWRGSKVEPVDVLRGQI
jgi:lipoprotein-releasing system permease protein